MHPNERLIRDLYEAMGRGNGRMLAARLSPSTQWIVRGEGILAGTYTGPDEIFGFWKQVAAKTGGGLKLEIEDVLANDRRAVALVTVRGRRGERQLDEPQVAVFEIAEEKVVSATFIYEQPHVYDAFWAE